ncbi:hypothetical protein [Tannockella kyphosi]|uniref:hypothetical protein n=1 Tax=Tannockella kyphosi TaxID=2899121 RepID=UPI00201316AC|nr:hypothetical protein [Tannockella kyphosi]
MDIYIKKDRQILFEKAMIYDCVIREDAKQSTYYKIYGIEYDLSCTENEFNEHFVLILKL